MPKRRRRLPGRYKEKPERVFKKPEFPLSLFQGENGLLGVKDAVGNTEAEAQYHRAPQSAAERASQPVRLAHHQGTEVLLVSPESYTLLCYFCLD